AATRPGGVIVASVGQLALRISFALAEARLRSCRSPFCSLVRRSESRMRSIGRLPIGGFWPPPHSCETSCWVRFWSAGWALPLLPALLLPLLLPWSSALKRSFCSSLSDA